MNRDATITKIIDQCLDGLLTMVEAHSKLDALQVRGGFDKLRYVGFDYRAQQWVERMV